MIDELSRPFRKEGGGRSAAASVRDAAQREAAPERGAQFSARKRRRQQEGQREMPRSGKSVLPAAAQRAQVRAVVKRHASAQAVKEW